MFHTNMWAPDHTIDSQGFFQMWQLDGDSGIDELMFLDDGGYTQEPLVDERLVWQ